ncbi:MAG: PepSY domain-containing protein [Bacteroidales bacterium]|nr:PepSY domain-containing protein [Bacteroidales bacterium]
MKNKKWAALLLTAVMAVPEMSAAAYAADTTGLEAEISEEDTTGTEAGTTAADSTETGAEATAADSTETETETSAEDNGPKAGHSKHGDKGKASKAGREKRSDKDKVSEPENAVGKDTARDIALADSGAGTGDAGKVKTRLSQMEDGTVVYRVSFTFGNSRYRYKINALTGEILDKTTKDPAGYETGKTERTGWKTEKNSGIHKHGKSGDSADTTDITDDTDINAEGGDSL